MTATCPQCSHPVFHMIGGDLRRCAECRWLYRIDAAGVSTPMVDPFAAGKRKPSRRRRTHRGGSR